MNEELRAKFIALIEQARDNADAYAKHFNAKAEDHEDRSAEETSAY